MEWHHVHGSNDFMVPSELDRLEVIPPSTEEDWFQWEVSRLENDRLRKYIAKSEKDNLTNLNSDARVPPLNESKVPQVSLGEGSSSLSPCEDGLLLDCSMRTSDDLFNDLPDFEIQTSMQNMDDIFLYKHNFWSPYEICYNTCRNYVVLRNYSQLQMLIALKNKVLKIVYS